MDNVDNLAELLNVKRGRPAQRAGDIGAIRE